MFARSSVTIGTRGSALALWQAGHVKKLLLEKYPGLAVSLEIIVTRGDKIIDLPLSDIGGKGLFISEIEDALFSGRVDVAVHSLKDMPMALPEGLFLGCILERGPVEDMLLSCHFKGLSDLPEGARVGSSSLRRAAQLKNYRPDFDVLPLRGNIDTRIKKLENGEYSAIVLALAGVERLGLQTSFMQPLDAYEFLPAAGQGALAVEFLEEREDLLALFSALEHRKTRFCIEAERSFVRELGGGCHAPIAALGRVMVDGGGKQKMNLAGFIATPAGNRCLTLYEESELDSCGTAVKMGLQLAERMRREGHDILPYITPPNM